MFFRASERTYRNNSSPCPRSWSRTAPDTITPPGDRRLWMRAAMLTASPRTLPAGGDKHVARIDPSAEFHPPCVRQRSVELAQSLLPGDAGGDRRIGAGEEHQEAVACDVLDPAALPFGFAPDDVRTRLQLLSDARPRRHSRRAARRTSRQHEQSNISAVLRAERLGRRVFVDAKQLDAQFDARRDFDAIARQKRARRQERRAVDERGVDGAEVREATSRAPFQTSSMCLRDTFGWLTQTWQSDPRPMIVFSLCSK